MRAPRAHRLRQRRPPRWSCARGAHRGPQHSPRPPGAPGFARAGAGAGARRAVSLPARRPPQRSGGAGPGRGGGMCRLAAPGRAGRALSLPRPAPPANPAGGGMLRESSREGAPRGFEDPGARRAPRSLPVPPRRAGASRRGERSREQPPAPAGGWQQKPASMLLGGRPEQLRSPRSPRRAARRD